MRARFHHQAMADALARVNKSALAEAAGISRQQLSRWAHGQDEPTAARLATVALLLGRPWQSFFLLEDGNPTDHPAGDDPTPTSDERHTA